jgi:hypothetical protein
LKCLISAIVFSTTIRSPDNSRAGGMTITVESEGDGLRITTLTGTLDQVALQGLLRRLYSLGLPLISVNCIACD